MLCKLNAHTALLVEHGVLAECVSSCPVVAAPVVDNRPTIATGARSSSLGKSSRGWCCIAQGSKLCSTCVAESQTGKY